MLLAVKTTLLLVQLRALFDDSAVVGVGGIDGYIVPVADAHNGERQADCDKRLKFISGFSGSYGFALITRSSAILWTDGRYLTQAEEELEADIWGVMITGVPGIPTIGQYITHNMTAGSKIGVDPSLYSKSTWDSLQSEISVGGQSLVIVRENLIDKVWGEGRPECPAKPLMMLGVEFTGKSSSEKLQDVRNAMTTEQAEAVVLSELDEIAWLLNLRGSDLESASVFISYLVLTNNSFELFIDSAKLNEEISKYVSDLGGTIDGYQNVTNYLTSMVETQSGKIWFSATCNYALVSLVPPTRQIIKLGPVSLMKAVKNSVEVEGMRNALIRDAAAVSKFLRWIENEMNNSAVVSELSAAAHLLSIRETNEHFITTSFTAISAAGANGAIIHYRPTVESNANITKDDMYLVDSGAIYKDGTTDITRTVHFGTPSDFQRECYTRVLKGQIAVALSVFPDRTVGSRVDSFARRALWNFGLDYGHGTGHGIGHALNVHEGPSAIKERHVPEDQGLRENMFTSNEPGYYEVGQFGIRLENVIRVQNVSLPHNFQNKGFIGFEDLTFVPYQQKLIKVELLTTKEIDYLNDYQEKVRSIVGSFIRDQDPADPTYDWIIKETQPIVSR